MTPVEWRATDDWRSMCEYCEREERFPRSLTLVWRPPLVDCLR